MKERRGSLDVSGRRFAIAAASFNEMVVGKLVEGALACFRAHGVGEDAIELAWVPGAFELPLLARRFAESGRYDAVVCLGAIVRGETPHFDVIAREAARGIQDAALATGVPVTLGVLTTDTVAQALERAGGSNGNKGWDAALAAIHMAAVLGEIEKGE
ncbi:MAG: 6,7-dimethyl-8-ribityllumazine synthase [Actinobacteria bacterium]|nr:MAG: 6,7-dimethyl-8-ribityllumazine synthase [Actinomycetota bacterium]